MTLFEQALWGEKARSIKTWMSESRPRGSIGREPEKSQRTANWLRA